LARLQFRESSRNVSTQQRITVISDIFAVILLYHGDAGSGLFRDPLLIAAQRQSHADKKLALVPYNKLLDHDPDNVEHLTRRANLYLQLGLNDSAMSSYKRASEIAKHKEAWILANIGNLYVNRGLFSDGAEFLKKALDLDAQDDYAHRRLSTALEQQKEEKKQLEILVKEANKALAMKLVGSITGS
jgi:tetratricopeptide (TPR) repeat protein